MRPSLALSISIVFSLIRSFLKNDVMNLPDPSGSSPPENPPGIKIIWDNSICFANSSIDLSMSSEVKLRIIIILGIPPALAIAFAESYSQFVPGNTGIRTCGFEASERAFLYSCLPFNSYVIFEIFSCFLSIFVLYIGSSLFSE